MARLPVADWPDAVAQSRFEFLRTAAYFVAPPEDAGEEGTGSAPESPSGRLTDYDALWAAADLAFAIDRTADGMDCLRELVADIFARDIDLRTAALPGAIAGTALTRAVEDGFQIEPVPRPRGLIAYTYPRALMTPQGLRLTLDLLLASLASGLRLEEFAGHAPEGGWWLTPGEPIVQATLSLFDTEDDQALRYARAHAALWVNAFQWADDLEIHRRDRYHWDEARVRGALIDTRWLAFEIAVRKWPPGAEFLAWRRERPFDTRLAQLDQFISGLADEILQREFQRIG